MTIRIAEIGVDEVAGSLFCFILNYDVVCIFSLLNTFSVLSVLRITVVDAQQTRVQQSRRRAMCLEDGSVGRQRAYRRALILT